MLSRIRSRFLFIPLLIVVAAALVFVFRERILVGMGEMLLFTEDPEHADIIVMLRGGLFERSVKAAELYRDGYADKVLVPRALSDETSDEFRRFGVTLPDGQEVTRDVLVQLGVDRSDIILSRPGAGGGTRGEAHRVKKELLGLPGVESFIVVTSWYHSRRVRGIYSDVFADTGLRFRVVASMYGKGGPDDWWRYRYVTLNVLTEFPKLFLAFVDPVFKLSFQDDPESAQDGPPLKLP